MDAELERMVIPGTENATLYQMAQFTVQLGSLIVKVQ
jgi:hypothetical protein